MPPRTKKTRIKNPSKSGRPPKSTRAFANRKPEKESLLSMHRDMLLIRRLKKRQVNSMGWEK